MMEVYYFAHVCVCAVSDTNAILYMSGDLYSKFSLKKACKSTMKIQAAGNKRNEHDIPRSPLHVMITVLTLATSSF